MNHWTLCALDVWYFLRWIAPAAAVMGVLYLWDAHWIDMDTVPFVPAVILLCVVIYIAAIAWWWL